MHSKEEILDSLSSSRPPIRQPHFIYIEAALLCYQLAIAAAIFAGIAFYKNIKGSELGKYAMACLFPAIFCYGSLSALRKWRASSIAFDSSDQITWQQAHIPIDYDSKRSTDGLSIICAPIMALIIAGFIAGGSPFNLGLLRFPLALALVAGTILHIYYFRLISKITKALYNDNQ